MNTDRAWFARFGEWVDHDWVLRGGFIQLNDRPVLGFEIKDEVLEGLAADRPMAYRQYHHADGSWKGW